MLRTGDLDRRLAAAAARHYSKHMHMRLDLPIPAYRLNDPLCAELDAATSLECDWCGKLVRPGNAVKRTSGDGELVVLCGECEFGTE